MAFVTAGAASHQERMSQYEMRYGEPVDVSISDLLQNPASYENRAVRTRGQLELDAGGSFRTYALRDSFGERVRVVPVPTSRPPGSPRSCGMIGRDSRSRASSCPPTTEQLQTAGAAAPGPSSSGSSWASRPRSRTSRKAAASPRSSSSRPTRRASRARSSRSSASSAAATCSATCPPKSQHEPRRLGREGRRLRGLDHGPKPKGEGFELDPGLKRDTGKWLEVVGRVDDAPRLRLPRRRSAWRSACAPTPAAQVRAAAAAARAPEAAADRGVRAAARRRERRAGRRRASPSSSARTWTRTASRAAWCCATRAGRSRAIATSTAS